VSGIRAAADLVRASIDENTRRACEAACVASRVRRPTPGWWPASRGSTRRAAGARRPCRIAALRARPRNRAPWRGCATAG